jgi:hypothetical protein
MLYVIPERIRTNIVLAEATRAIQLLHIPAQGLAMVLFQIHIHALRDPQTLILVLFPHVILANLNNLGN